MKKYLLLLAVFCTAALCYGQVPVIEEDVEDQREEAEELDNSLTQLRYGTNLTIDPADSLNTLIYSPSLNITFNKELRIAKFYSLGLNYGVQYDNFKIEQDSSNLLSPAFLNDKQQVRLYTFRLGLMNRIHLGKHGVKEGAYLEFGGYGAIRVTSRMLIENEVDPNWVVSQGAEELNTMYKRLQWVELLQYYASAAIGRNGVALYGEYRLSDLFKAHEGINGGRKLPEIALLNVGIRFEF